jgi:hypothetical protein
MQIEWGVTHRGIGVRRLRKRAGSVGNRTPHRREGPDNVGNAVCERCICGGSSGTGKGAGQPQHGRLVVM